MWQVYILRSLADGRHYVGMTSMAIEERLARHNAGRVKSTKGRCPFELLYVESHPSASEARGRERFLKAGEGREFFRELGLG
jgi:putative endonuclease